MKIARTIDKSKITELLEAMAKKYRLFAPVEKDNITAFTEIDNAKDITLDFYNTKEPPKKIFLPQTETLFCYSKGQQHEVPAEADKRQRVIVGIRPCDAKALTLLDNVFDADDYKDPYYIEKRKNTVIFSLACNRPQKSCFCTSFGIGPYAKQGCDVLMVDLGEKYLLETITEKGQKLLETLKGLADAEDEDLAQAQQAAVGARDKVHRHLDTDGLAEKLDDMWDHSVWERLHERCLGCGVCTYLCPTCHCFDIADEAVGYDGRRVRNWDSCMFGAFTLEASGHNPRPGGKERMRQRIMHKFNYFVKNFGDCACVGCGRCMRNCPVNADIVGMIETIKNAK